MEERAFPGRVIFDHQPKTAGQSVNAWLIKSLGAGCVTSNLIGRHADLIRQYGGLYSVISAHLNFEANEGLDPRYQYVTCLREPIDRALSWLYFLVNRVKPTDITGYLVEGAKRFLASDGEEVSKGFYPTICNPYTEHFCLINGKESDPDDIKVANALAALKNYHVLGLYEDMPSFLGEFAALIGLPPVKTLQRINSTGDRPDAGQISPALRVRIAALNRMDLRLYARVLAWKQSGGAEEGQGTEAGGLPRWVKYAGIKPRSVVSNDIVILSAVCREGDEILHKQIMAVEVDFFVARIVLNLKMEIEITDVCGRLAFATDSDMLGYRCRFLESGQYRAKFEVTADLPAGRYAVAFGIAEHGPKGKRELFWQDKLLDFLVYHKVKEPFRGYAYLPASVALTELGQVTPDNRIIDAKGRMDVVKPVALMSAKEVAEVGVKVANHGKQLWVGDIYRPVRFSYHWLDSAGAMLNIPNLRTSLPDGGIVPGQSLNAEMLVEAPDCAGTYTLVLTLVQESVLWFEDHGFKPARLEIKITP
jgi:hypothetical protein